MSLQIAVSEKLPGYYEFGLDGRLDTETYGQLENALNPLKAHGIRFDMAKLSYISSMGLRVVMKVMKELKEKKGAFQLINLQPQIKKVFDIAAALPKGTIFASVEEADSYFDAMQKKVLNPSED